MTRPTAVPEFSVVVPTLNEEGEIEETLRRARRALGPSVETLVADGGSRDRTVERARPMARVLASEPCRGRQLAAGARAARGRIVVFLHADTWLDEGAGEAIREAIEAGAVGGCCRFALRPGADSLRYRLLERGVNWRTRRFRTATGDQAIFARRDLLERGLELRPQPLFEDLELARDLRAHGRFAVADAAARTSSRRWERRGFALTLLTHWGLRAAYLAGADPGWLARRYRAWRPAAGPSAVRDRPAGPDVSRTARR